MSAKLLRLIEDVISRRTFLQKFSAATTAFVSGVLFAPDPSHATPLVKVLCCKLCHAPGTCSYSGCTCEWAWNCCQDKQGGCQPDPQKYRCFECIETPIPPCAQNAGGFCWGDPDCGLKAQCPGVKCSKIQPIPGNLTCPGMPC